jgi:2-methylisocitrate lyase-like PEP mutase family enzyme
MHMPSASLSDRANAFADLHARDGIFVLPNPWDVGSARMLAALGFDALATTSAGFAFSKGVGAAVGVVDRDTALAHAAEIVGATNLPVSADLENGFGHAPEDVAETVRRAGEVGLCGCTIEDVTGDRDKPIYEQSHAIERIAAGVEAARALGRPFMLTARAENYLFGRPDFDETLARLQGYEKVGADVLYAPGLPDIDAIATACRSVGKPVNVVAGIGLAGVTLGQLADAGVKRVSVGSSLARVAFGAFVEVATAIRDVGDFSAFETAATFADLGRLIKDGRNRES